MTADDIVLHYLETGVLDEDAAGVPARSGAPALSAYQLPDLDQLLVRPA